MNMIEFVLSDKFAYLVVAASIGFVFGQIYERAKRK